LRGCLAHGPSVSADEALNESSGREDLNLRPPGPQKSGHFCFAQTGHSHFAATGESTSLDRNVSSVYGITHDDSENPRDDVLRMSLYVLRTRVLWHREASNSALKAEN
jgi:hypothetical protein